MTEKQIERVKVKIVKYKKALANDKKMWGGYYHDGGGIRYCLPELYVKIKDYKGGLRYMRWFEKNFPDDSGDPFFLFESGFILFMCGKLEDAAVKCRRADLRNAYLFDKFLGKDAEISETEKTSWEYKMIQEHFTYSNRDPEFIPFSNWLDFVLNAPAKP